jgi:hypothetical protein
MIWLLIAYFALLFTALWIGQLILAFRQLLRALRHEDDPKTLPQTPEWPFSTWLKPIWDRAWLGSTRR